MLQGVNIVFARQPKKSTEQDKGNWLILLGFRPSITKILLLKTVNSALSLNRL